MIKRLKPSIPHGSRRRQELYAEDTPSTLEREASFGRSRSFTPEELKKLPGAVLMLANSIQKINNLNSKEHPAIVRLVTSDNCVLCHSGTDVTNLAPKHREKYNLTIHPDGGNGLSKTTAFQFHPRRIPARRLFRSSRIGRLSSDDWHLAQSSLYSSEGVKHE